LRAHAFLWDFLSPAAVRVGAGLGLDKLDFSHLPEALTEARIALDFSSPGRAVVPFADVDLTEVVLHNAQKAVLGLIPEWVRKAHAEGRHPELIDTIRAFAECSLNVKTTAGRLGVHPNTVYFRLNQINKRAGVDPRTFSGTSLLLISLRLLEQRWSDR
jgi:DNA-binding PucR family transcriptional regulator